MERKKIAFCLVALSAALCVIFLPGFSELQKLRGQNEQHLSRIALLEEHNDKLQWELAKMRDDPEYVKMKAREKLGIIKKDEIIYRKKRVSP